MLNTLSIFRKRITHVIIPSKLSHHIGVHPGIDTIGLLQYQLLKLMVGFGPLLHQGLILIEFLHQTLNQLTLKRQLLQQQMLRQRIHQSRLLYVLLEVIDQQIQ